LLKLPPLLTQRCLPERLDRLRDGRLVGGLGHRQGAPHQGHAAESERASSHQVTTRDVHVPTLHRVLSGACRVLSGACPSPFAPWGSAAVRGGGWTEPNLPAATRGRKVLCRDPGRPKSFHAGSRKALQRRTVPLKTSFC